MDIAQSAQILGSSHTVSSAERLSLPRSIIGVLVAFGVVAGTLLAIGRRDYLHLHTILDTGMALLSGVLALLLWDMGARMKRPFPKWLSIAFGTMFVLEFIHVLTTLDWAGPFGPLALMHNILRPATWPPASHILPIGILAAFWLMQRGRSGMLSYAVAMAIVAVGLLAAFHSLPAYTPPGPLGITRPALIVAPLLWAITVWKCWRLRAADRLFWPLTVMAAVLFVGNTAMLYSQAPHDTQAMMAHLGKLVGDLVLLLFLMQMAASDMFERIRAEGKLARLNEELEQRVRARTVQLESTNRALESEIGVRRQAEQQAQEQLGRLNLMHQITRAIGERRELNSLFEVVARSLEQRLPADFVCLCFHDTVDHTLAVARVGPKSAAIARDLAMPERGRVDIDDDGLSRSVGGELVYEPNLGAVESPFWRRLAQVGLRSVVLVPVQAESQVFGILVVARTRVEGFGSDEYEFLQQLGEHLALVVHQAQL